MSGLDHFKLDSVEFKDNSIDDISQETEEEQKKREEEDAQKIKTEQEEKKEEVEEVEEKEETDFIESELLIQRDLKLEEIEKKEEAQRSEDEKSFLEKFKIENKENKYIPIFKTLEEEGILEISKDKEYEDSEEGFKNLITDNIKLGITSYKEELPSKVKDLLTFVENGGTLEQYEDSLFEENYSEVDITIKTNQQVLVRDYYLTQGLSEEDIQEKIQLFEENDKLEKEALLAKKNLSAIQTKNLETKQKAQEDLAKEQKKEYNNNLKDFKEKISSLESIAGFKVNKKEILSLQDYMLKPTMGGKTQYQVDSSNVDNQIKQAYLLQKNFKFKDLEKKVGNQKTIELRKQLDKLSKGVSSSRRGTIRTEAPTKESDKLVIHVPSFLS